MITNPASTKKSPFLFFLVVYGLSIPLWILETRIEVKGLPLDIPITDIFAAFTPLIAACLLTYQAGGKKGIGELFQRIFDFSRIKKKIYYVSVIFLPFILYLLIYLVIYLTGLPLPSKIIIPFSSIPVLFFFFFLGAVVEETGYMGYAIDPMQEKNSALTASILMGIPWAVWHYPSIIQQGHGATWIFWGTLGTVGVRVLIVWIYNNTGKSVSACILFHALLNVGRPLFPQDATHHPLVDYPYIHYSVMAIAAVVVVFLWGPGTLARFRFGRFAHKVQVE